MNEPQSHRERSCSIAPSSHLVQQMTVWRMCCIAPSSASMSGGDTRGQMKDVPFFFLNNWVKSNVQSGLNHSERDQGALEMEPCSHVFCADKRAAIGLWFIFCVSDLKSSHFPYNKTSQRGNGCKLFIFRKLDVELSKTRYLHWIILIIWGRNGRWRSSHSEE